MSKKGNSGHGIGGPSSVFDSAYSKIEKGRVLREASDGGKAQTFSSSRSSHESDGGGGVDTRGDRVKVFLQLLVGFGVTAGISLAASGDSLRGASETASIFGILAFVFGIMTIWALIRIFSD